MAEEEDGSLVETEPVLFCSAEIWGLGTKPGEGCPAPLALGLWAALSCSPPPVCLTLVFHYCLAACGEDLGLISYSAI